MTFVKAKKKLTLAVRDFAVPLKRRGSLGSTHTSALPIDLGQEIHESIQQRLKVENQDYLAEYPLQIQIEGRDLDFRIRGRCDGFLDGDIPLLEEIKSSFAMASLREALTLESEHPYLLQTRLYGYIFFLRTQKIPTLRLRLVDTRTRKEEIFPVAFDPELFECWVRARQVQIESEWKRYAALVKTRKRIATRLYFPFKNPRIRQEDLVTAVAKNLEGGRHLLLQAPTGLGKTAGVLYPALVFALARGAPVVYVAPKNSQFQAAIDLGIMFQKSKVPLKVLVLTSKAKACRQDQVLCQASNCTFALSYFDKIEEASLVSRDRKKHLWDYRYFQTVSDVHQVCPYEIAMARIREADLIICDYNYIFSPRANFFDRYLDPILPMKKPVLVIDEAHNLYERVIENYSPEIRLSSLKAFLVQAAQGADNHFARVISESIALMSRVSPASREAKVFLSVEEVKDLLNQSLSLMTSRWGGEGLPTEEDPLFQFFTQWFDLSEMLEASREDVPLIYKKEEGDEVLRAQCIDPSTILSPLYIGFQGVVAFSATLKPFPFYRHMSGFLPETTDAIEFGSPFPRLNKKIMIIPQVQTAYRERGRHYQRIAEIIARVADLNPGPYLVFFSSFQFLRSVQEWIEEKKGREVYAQERSLSAYQVREVFDFIKRGQGTQLVLAVQGGSLSEGIDFQGMGLRGVFIVGPAVPIASFERKLMQEHFEKLYGNGKSFAFVYPSMTRSVQAAGRIVRNEVERGLIILLDPRFLEKDYQETMPSDWFEFSAEELVPRQILSEIESFWAKDATESSQSSS